MIDIFPSLMAADQLNLEHEISMLDDYCTGYHLDIMDDHFVPNIALNLDTINGIASITKRQLWVHLMVENPMLWIKKLHLPPKTIISFHIENKPCALEAKNKIKENKWLASLAINPKTPLEELLPHIDQTAHQVLFMTVDPGFSGQSLVPDALKKLPQLLAYRATHNLTFKIAIDGGINATNIQSLVNQGAQQLAIGNGIFAHKDRVAAIKVLQNLANQPTQ